MVIDVQCYEGRNLDTVTQVETLAPYGDSIARDYVAYTTATVMLETTLQLTEEHEPQTQQYLLLGRSAALARRARSRTRARARRVPAALARRRRVGAELSRLRPVRGRPGPHRAFNVQAGGAVVFRMPPTRLERARTGDLRAARGPAQRRLGAIADGSDPRHRRQGNGLVAAFLQWHIERGLRSLRLVERA